MRCFFVAKYISKIFELLFMTKNSNGMSGEWGMVVFFVAKYISKLFELLFLAKKSATGGSGVW